MKFMLTKSDLEKISKLISSSFNDPENSLRKDFENLRKEVKNDIVTFKDEILGEIRGLRDEITIVTGYKDQIENHEDRIVSLEKRLPH